MTTSATEKDQAAKQSTPELTPPLPSVPTQDTPISPSSVRVPGLGSGLGLGGTPSSKGLEADLDSKDSKSEQRPGRGSSAAPTGGLAGLVQPKVFVGPEVKLQNALVDELEVWAMKEPEESGLRMKNLPLMYLGSIELTNIPPDKDGEPEMIKNARLVETDNALGPLLQGFEMVTKAGVERAIITNTLSTMIRADQMQYLRTSGVVGPGWKVVVEVHYFRERGKDAPSLHKDTLGQTMFVNLNYVNKDEIPGPEFIVNPPLVDSHEQEINKNLPPQFLTDLAESRKTQQPETIQTEAIPANGVVSFVDEAIHHATPLRRGREVGMSDLKAFLKEDPDFKNQHDEAQKAYAEAYPGGVWDYRIGKPFSWFFTSKDITGDQKDRWKWLIALTRKPETTVINRAKLQEYKMTPEQVDRLLERSGPAGYSKVNIPPKAHVSGTKETSVPIPAGPSGKPRKRAMSQLALDKQLPRDDPKAPRRFFRTWVRAVRTSKSAEGPPAAPTTLATTQQPSGPTVVPKLATVADPKTTTVKDS